jgi:hypothetical protein
MADGICPCCGKNVNELAGSDPTKVLVGIRSGQSLPPICHCCGAPTRTSVRLSAESEPQGTSLVSGIGELFGHFVKGLGFFDTMERYNKTVEVGLRLPTCKPCIRKLRRITPEYIDFDAHRIDLVVHVEFKKALEHTAPG